MTSGHINSHTKISVLIKANSLVIDALVSINANFSKLRNPFLRKLLASRVNIGEACKVAGCTLEDFMGKMRELGFETGLPAKPVPDPQKITGSENVRLTELDQVILDVRPILAVQQDPLKVIIGAVNSLKDGQCLKLINTFEPVPLINLLSKKGYIYHIERPNPELVITYFTKIESSKSIQIPISENPIVSNNAHDFDQKLQAFSPDHLETIDVRELEMPMPMVTILQHLEKLPLDFALFVHHKKIPVYLLPELNERGFKYLLHEVADQKVDMLIYK